MKHRPSSTYSRALVRSVLEGPRPWHRGDLERSTGRRGVAHDLKALVAEVAQDAVLVDGHTACVQRLFPGQGDAAGGGVGHHHIPRRPRQPGVGHGQRGRHGALADRGHQGPSKRHPFLSPKQLHLPINYYKLKE